ncbi:MAG TPA: hypothetical protein VHL33_08745, partial [Casimicrobiaceae bacterium]|nr:hypothetical protein [Casimicrobiaceae bacterium]
MNDLLQRPLALGAALVRAAGASHGQRFALEIPDGARRTLATRWLGLGLAALVASGVLSLL